MVSKFVCLVLLLVKISMLEKCLCSKYAFHQFENFPKNHETFIQEQKLISTLKDFKKNLIDLKNNININKSDYITIYDKLRDTKKILAKIESLGKNAVFVSQLDFIGAIKGILMLQETYQLDPIDFLHGYFTFKNETFLSHKLNLEDLKELAFIGMCPMSSQLFVYIYRMKKICKLFTYIFDKC